MALTTQTKILRALQEGEIQRVGSSDTIKVNVRMLAATNKPLEEMVKEKTFREDLYYRLNVVRVQLPPLRERKEDVPQLIDFVLKRLARDSKIGRKTISPEALTLLNQHRWPGNVRELENLIYRSAVLAQGEMILIKDLPQEVVQAIDGGPSADTTDSSAAAEDINESLKDEDLIGQVFSDPSDAVYRDLREMHGNNILEHAERALIARALKESKGKQIKAAEILGMTRATLRKRIDQYDLG
jgi:two-component system nitrogen regulation response regulator GlnG